MKRWFVFGLVVLALSGPALAGNRDFTARVYIPQEWWRQESLLTILNDETDVVYVEFPAIGKELAHADQIRAGACGIPVPNSSRPSPHAGCGPPVAAPSCATSSFSLISSGTLFAMSRKCSMNVTYSS